MADSKKLEVTELESDQLKTYLSVPLLKLAAEQVLPASLYLCLNHRLVKFKNKGDLLDLAAFDKLVFHHVRYLFIEEADRKAVDVWISEIDKNEKAKKKEITQEPEARLIASAVDTQRRAMMDLFEHPHNDQQVKAAIDISKRMVIEFMKKPFAINNVQSLQRYGRGSLDHSVNVSVLSVFLGIRMGYTHQVILENLALGGLFHDIGKLLVEPTESAIDADDNPDLMMHPRLGKEMISKIHATQNPIPREVEMIIMQHHEYLDGTGYPENLKGLAIYDLARIVTIANEYDNLITQSKAENIKDRCTEALDRLETEFKEKLDSKKLEKTLKILRYSLF